MIRSRVLIRRWKGFSLRSRFMCTKKSKPSSTTPQSPGIMDQASVMERSLMKTLRVRSQNRFRMGLGLAFVVGIVAYAFYPEAKKKTSSEFAEVAGGVIQDAEVQKKAETLATAVVHTVLNDPSVLKIATRFVAELARDPELQQVAAVEGAKISKQIVKHVLDDPETTKYVVKVLQRATKDPETQAALLDLTYWLLEQESVRQQLVKLTNGVLVDPAFLKESAALGTWISHQVLDDEAVYNHSCDFCMALLSDPTLQQTAGNAMWQSAKVIISPTSWIFGSGVEGERSSDNAPTNSDDSSSSANSESINNSDSDNDCDTGGDLPAATAPDDVTTQEEEPPVATIPAT